MSRWQAFATHLLLSIIVIGGVLAAMVWIWYPPPLFGASGVHRFAIVFASVDVVLGPLLTLIIFNPAKRSLKLDLACIGLLQCAALIYGLNIVRETRPVFLVATETGITLVTANMVDFRTRDAAPAEYRKDPWFGPKLVAVREPEDSVAFGGRLTRALNTGYRVESVPAYYEPYESIARVLVEQAKPLAQLEIAGEAEKREVQRFIAKHDAPIDSLVYVPFEAPDRLLVAALLRSTGEWVGLLDIDPNLSVAAP